MAFAVLDLLPATQDQRKLFRAADQRRDAGQFSRFEADFRRPLRHHLKRPRGPGQALELMLAQVAIVEIVQGETPRLRRNDDAIRLR